MKINKATHIRDAKEVFHASSGTGIETTLPELAALRPLARSLGRIGPARTSARLSGAHRSPVRGRGMEFCEVRAYAPGDEVRHIDWRVTARTAVPHSKLFEEERERPVMIVADMRAPMHFGTRRCFKSVAVARAAALLIWMASERGDRVGGVTLSAAGLHSQRMRRDQSGVTALLSALASATITGVAEDDTDSESSPSLADALLEVRRLAAQGTEVFILSDFSDLDSEASLHLRGLSRRTHTTCLLVHDPIESAPPAPGRYRVSDGRQALVVGLENEVDRSAWTAPFQSRHAALQVLCHESGSRLNLVSTIDGGLHFEPAAHDASLRAPSTRQQPSPSKRVRRGGVS